MTLSYFAMTWFLVFALFVVPGSCFDLAGAFKDRAIPVQLWQSFSEFGPCDMPLHVLASLADFLNASRPFLEAYTELTQSLLPLGGHRAYMTTATYLGATITRALTLLVKDKIKTWVGPTCLLPPKAPNGTILWPVDPVHDLFEPYLAWNPRITWEEPAFGCSQCVHPIVTLLN